MTLVILILSVAGLVLAIGTIANPAKVPVQVTLLVVAITLAVIGVVSWAGAR